MDKKKHKRHWIKLAIQAFKIYLGKADETKDLVNKSYNKIAGNYDQYWTSNMDILSEEMINKLKPSKKCKALDLTCGTGFVTRKLFEKTHGNITGVDASEGMIKIAKQKYGDECSFIQSDIIDYLK